MSTFFENLADILENLPSNPLAVVSLVIVAIGLLAFLFFARESLWARLIAFVFCFAGAVGIVYAVLSHETPNTPQPSLPVASGDSTDVGGRDVEEIESGDMIQATVDCNDLENVNFEKWMEQCNDG